MGTRSKGLRFYMHLALIYGWMNRNITTSRISVFMSQYSLSTIQTIQHQEPAMDKQEPNFQLKNRSEAHRCKRSGQKLIGDLIVIKQMLGDISDSDFDLMVRQETIQLTKVRAAKGIHLCLMASVYRQKNLEWLCFDLTKAKESYQLGIGNLQHRNEPISLLQHALNDQLTQLNFLNQRQFEMLVSESVRHAIGMLNQRKLVWEIIQGNYSRASVFREQSSNHQSALQSRQQRLGSGKLVESQRLAASKQMIVQNRPSNLSAGNPVASNNSGNSSGLSNQSINPHLQANSLSLPRNSSDSPNSGSPPSSSEQNLSVQTHK